MSVAFVAANAIQNKAVKKEELDKIIVAYGQREGKLDDKQQFRHEKTTGSEDVTQDRDLNYMQMCIAFGLSAFESDVAVIDRKVS